MKKLSLQWRLTVIISLLIAFICVLLNFILYKNGVYYIDNLQEIITGNSDENECIYIEIQDENWDDFVADFSIKVYDSKVNYKQKSILITVIITLISGVITYVISGKMLKPLREFSEKIESVQARNLTDFTIEEDGISEFKMLSSSYNKMLLRLSESFEIQRQFTGNAAHELRTPLAVLQAQLDLYQSSKHPENNEDAVETIEKIIVQNERLSRLVKTLLEMSELQTIQRNDQIEIKNLVEEVLEDLEPLAKKKEIELIENCVDSVMIGSDILIYRMVYNLVDNAIKYNYPGGKVIVSVEEKHQQKIIRVADTGKGISIEDRKRIFEPFFRVDKSRSRAEGGVGLGLALVHEIVRLHDGKITIGEQKEKGTVFEITLP